jgi:DegV family protein with EDD domain
MSEAEGRLLRLGGRTFAQVVRAGALAVAREQETLNRINVFPVRDAHTVYNGAATWGAAAARLGDDSPEEVGAAARVAADAALDGARGNSGAIVAQFLHGLAVAASGAVALSTPEFAAAAHRGTKAAYAALADPREGTILSVLRAWALALHEHAPNAAEFPELLRHGLAGARQALADTPRQLEVLARSHVVDAGGQGFVYFLEGISDFLRAGRGSRAAEVTAWPAAPAPAGAAHELDERFRYCTEALVSAGDDVVDRAALFAAVAHLGESLVIAGGDSRVRVHLHTNEPRLLLQALAAFGRLEQTKVDDMILQQIGGRTAGIALVTDSTCELPERQAFDLGVVSVPLTISFGEQSYLDGVDMTLDGFVSRLRLTADPPTSSQPPVVEFRDVYQHLLEYRDGIVSIHIAAAQSGTWQSAQAAARLADPQRVRVIDSHTNSVGAGLLIEAVGEALRQGSSLDELERLALRVRDDITVFGAMQDLEFAVRGGRVSARAARVVDGLHLKPIIVFDESGKAGMKGAAVGFRRAMDSLARRVERFAGEAPVRLMITHTDAQEWVDYLRARLRERLGVDEVPAVRSGAVLTAHVGLGSVSVAVRRLPTACGETLTGANPQWTVETTGRDLK